MDQLIDQPKRIVYRNLTTEGPSIGVCVRDLSGPSLAATIAASGADYALIDMEHTSLSFRDLANFVVAARAGSLPVLVRPPHIDAATIGRVLDLGADGILAQGIGSGATAAAVVRAAKYPPLGGRGDDGSVSSSRVPRTTIDARNDRTLVLVIVEDIQGTENIDDICTTDGVDAVWVGPSDLSLSLGVPGDFDSETYRSAEGRVIETCRARGMHFAIGEATTEDLAREQATRGSCTVLAGDELGLIHRALSRYINVMRA